MAADFTGEGRLQFQNGDIYEGSFVMGKMEGVGSLRTLGGDVYTGSFKNGFKHGKGKIVYGSGNNRGGSYEGDWSYNKKEGRGVCIDSNGDRYDGAFMGNSRHGDGTQVYASNGARYVGMWQHNLPHQGKLILSDGTLYEGDWKDDMFSGVGRINYANGDTY